LRPERCGEDVLEDERELQRESISSIKIMEGFFSRVSWKRSLIKLGDFSVS